MKIINPFFSLRILTVILLLISVKFNIHSQSKFQFTPKLSHPLNYHPVLKQVSYYDNSLFRSFAPETLNVYAIRVQFKPDNNNQTTGNGRFNLSNSYPDSVDAPPHDSLYFTYKLEFLKNYYFKASKGNLIINYTLLPTVRNLSNEMEAYSPRRNESLLRMGNLFYDVWRSADSTIDFSGINASNSAFIIFHAGVGRDVDLSGFFQGELDLPSIFMGISTLKSLYGDTTQGYYTNEGLIISGSCILPEQEWRIVNSSFGDVFLELGLNGIVVGTIGSYLGLPDLFDTRTGRTAIGRFGLMDGQGIFSYLGVFPPEPSAWEKQYLGWVEPVLVSSNGTYTTKASSIDFNGNESVYKVLISAKEYFLIENRNRDALGNGQTVYFVRNGVRDSIKFLKDVDGFNSADISALKGSIVDVDELDWSVPGLKNDTADFQGGILIWHIDENVIDANIASNTVNVDIKHRGVDVEEAKGSQDIGVVVSTPLGDLISDGFFVDFWYNGNHYRPANIYKNEFTPTSIPNSKSYSNINSRVCITNFTQIGPSMTFNYQLCGNITNINTFPRYVGVDNSGNAQPIGFDYNGNGFDEIFVNVKDSLYGFRDNGNSIRIDMPNGFLMDTVANYIVSHTSITINNLTGFLISSNDNKINLINFTIDTLTSAPNVIQFASNSLITTPSLYLLIDSSFNFGTADGKICKLNLNSQSLNYDSVSNRRIVSLSLHTLDGSPLANLSHIDESNKYFSEGVFIDQPGVLFDPEGSDPVIISNDNKIMFRTGQLLSGTTFSSIFSTPVVSNLNSMGSNDIIFTADNKIIAMNHFGAFLDNFPFSIAGVNKISSGCSVADLNDDGIYEVIFGTGDGRVYAYSANGSILDGFPLLTGGEVKSTPAIINYAGNFGIVVYSTDGNLYGWKTPWTYNQSKIQWRNYLTNIFHHNSNLNNVIPVTTGPCLPSDKVYNWPNPAYGKSTNIRYFLNGDVTSVNIKIMDLSGELVTTLTGTTNKGFDNEVPWDISTVQSGIYIAVVELEGGCGETASIKIAVVK
ncbi:MAG: T9SS type A sorting domain-containing protein [Chlorobi bacterium]|nr:T9SS type A sorting domain-containing protein [Chlorobiota bacterium]MCI0716689.1 T9SS type A sorting domain-containing protein [Chlorobiota bacterium]